jgi:3,4-dihydroxy 2-butanone 4-phosphate synthase/GTP cyclohydrolase II
VTGAHVLDSDATASSTPALFPDTSIMTPNASAVRNGEPVVLVSRSRGDIVVAAEAMTSSLMSFMVRHTSGLVYVAMPVARTLLLGLPPMVASGRRSRETVTVTVDAMAGVGTGISAADRSRTIRCLAGVGSHPDDFSRPGHGVPVAIDPTSDIGKPTLLSHALELVSRTSALPAVASATVVSSRRPTELADRDELIAFARARDLAYVIVDD